MAQTQLQMRLLHRILNLAFLALLTFVLMPMSAAYTRVSISIDDPNPNAVNNGRCSLIEAIDNANADAVMWADCPAGAGHDTLVLQTAVIYSLTMINNTNDGHNGLPSITTDITIEGNGATITRSSVAPLFRIFHITKNGNLTLDNVYILSGTATGGGTSNNGGGLFNRGSVKLTNSTVSKHKAQEYGGGIYNLGALSTANATISGNDALSGGGISNVGQGTVELGNSTIKANGASAGGGIYNENGTLAITQSTINNNAATGGGGIYVTGGDARLVNSTVSGNQAAPGNGGGIYNSDKGGSVTLIYVTVTNNEAVQGGGLFNISPSLVTLSNTIVADNSSGNDCAGLITSQDYNLDSDNTCNLMMPHDLPAGAANLGPLANNGGPTQTHSLLTGSDALNAGDNATCAAFPINKVDQRGFTRPAFVTCDIGAYERQFPTIFLPVILNQYDPAKAQATALIRQAAPDLLNFRLDKLDTVAMHAQLNAGLPIRLPYVPDNDPGNEQTSPRYQEVTLKPQDILANNFTAYLANGPDQLAEIELPPVQLFHTTVFTPLLNVSLMVGCQPGWETGCDPEWAMGYVQKDDGWSFIEPIERLLWRAGMDPAPYAEILSQYDHVVYNVKDVVFQAPHEVGEEEVEAFLSESIAGVAAEMNTARGDVTIVDGELSHFDSQALAKVPAISTDVTFSLWLDYEFSAAEAGVSSGAALTAFDIVPAYFRVLNTLAGVRDNLQTAAPHLNIYIRVIRFESSQTTQCLTATTRASLLQQSRTCSHNALHVADLIHVFSGKIGGGLASIRGLLAPPDCSSRYPAYICNRSGIHKNHGVEGHSGPLSNQILLATHEIGHNFGATHGDGNSRWGFPEDVLLAGNFVTSNGFNYDDILCGHSVGGNIDFFACGNYPRDYFDPILNGRVTVGNLRRIRPPYFKSLNDAGAPDDRYLAGDFNGDSVMDVAIGRPTGSGVEWHVALHQPTTVSSYKLSPPTLWHAGLGQPDSQYFVGDFDGDGYDDLGYTGPGTLQTLTWTVARSTGSQFSLAAPGGQWSSQIGILGNSFLVADFTGDGKADVTIGHIQPSEPLTWRTAVSNGKGFESDPRFPLWLTGGEAGDLFFTGDFNADSRADLAVAHAINPGQIEWQIALSDKEKFADLIVWANDIGNEGDRFLIMDISGDGRDDLVFGHPALGSPNGPYGWFGYESNGMGFETVFHVLSTDACLNTTPLVCGTDIMLMGYGYGFGGRIVPTFSWANTNDILSTLNAFNTYPPP